MRALLLFCALAAGCLPAAPSLSLSFEDRRVDVDLDVCAEDSAAVAPLNAPRSVTKVLTVGSAANVAVQYSTAFRHAVARCLNTSTGVPVYVVEQAASSTAAGLGPYCDTCAGNVALPPLGVAYLRTSSGSANVACDFLEVAPSGFFTGASSGGMSTGLADGRYLKLAADNDPLTGDLAITNTADSARTLSVTTTNAGTSAHANVLSTVVDNGNTLSAYLSAFSSTFQVTYLQSKAVVFTSPLVTDLLLSSSDKVVIAPGSAGYGSAGNAAFEVDIISGATTEVVVNQSGRNDHTLRVEGDVDTSLIQTDAVNDRVGIGDATPDAKLDVGGTMRCDGLFTHGGDIQPTGDLTLALGAAALRYNTIFAAILASSSSINVDTPVVNFYDGAATDFSVTTTTTAADGVRPRWVDTYTTLPTCNSAAAGSMIFYEDGVSNQTSFCGCERTGVATFAWGPLVAGGDCT